MAIDLTCPKCHAPMRQYERNGVTVDQCTECRGVFLDRGELDHLVNAEQQWNANRYGTQVPRPAGSPPSPDDYGHRPGYGQPGYDPRYRKKRKRSFLDDLFD
jgi:Zn-finger nucleic acid-binding protein